MNEYDFPEDVARALVDPANNRANYDNLVNAAGGEDPKTARYPWLLERINNPNARPPSPFEAARPWAYDSTREPIIGEGGQTPDPNKPDGWAEFVQAGFMPPKGSIAEQGMKENFSSVGETFEQTLSRMDLTGPLGLPLREYPTDLKPVTNPEAIPDSGSIGYNPPAYKTVQNPDGTTTIEYTNAGWDGQNAGWQVDPYAATSPKNNPALGAGMTPDDPNFKPTPNPPAWILPNGNSTKSIPGSGQTVGFNPETWSWQTRPWEVGNKTTFDMAATNPTTGKIDLSMVTKEVAKALQAYGNLPEEYSYLVDSAPSYYDQKNYSDPSATPISTPKGTTPTTPAKKTPPTPDKTTTPPPATAPVFTGRPLAENAAPASMPSASTPPPPREPAVNPGQVQPTPRPTPPINPVGGLPGGAGGRVAPVVPNPISLPRMTAL